MSSDATTRSVRAVGVWRATTVKVANARAPNSAAAPAQAQTPRDADDRDARGGQREELHETHVPVAVAQDHRRHRLDLGDRREGVDPDVRSVEHVRDGVLLLPERGPREVVEQRVRQALREREADEEQVEMHGDRESRERGDGPVVERVTQSVRPGERDGAGDGRTTTMRRGPGRTRPRRPRAGRAASAHARARERARRRRSPRLRECRRRGGSRPSSASAGNSTRALRSRRRVRTRCPGQHAHAPRLTR